MLTIAGYYLALAIVGTLVILMALYHDQVRAFVAEYGSNLTCNRLYTGLHRLPFICRSMSTPRTEVSFG